MENNYQVVFITTPSKAVAHQIAESLLERQLAACVNIIPGITSLYIWNGTIQEDQEFLCVVKTRKDIFSSQLVPAVESLHPYETPEIIALPIEAGNTAYLNWISQATGKFR